MSGANNGGSATVYFEKSSQAENGVILHLKFLFKSLMKNVFAKVAALSVMQCGVASFAC